MQTSLNCIYELKLMAGAKRYNVRSVFFMLELKSLSDQKTISKDSWVFTEFAKGNHVASYSSAT